MSKKIEDFIEKEDFGKWVVWYNKRYGSCVVLSIHTEEDEKFSKLASAEKCIIERFAYFLRDFLNSLPTMD